MSPRKPTKSISVLLAVVAFACGCETLEDETGNPEEGARVLSASAQCVSVNENAAATLACPDGQTISSVDFASYGTPAGTCDAGFTQSSCHASRSKSKVEGSCLDETSCKLSATNGVFGDPCPGTYKRLSVLYTCSGGLESGLLGTYFDNMNLTGQVLTRVDPTINFDWGTGSPAPAIGKDTFSARWTGFVQAKSSETYTFYTVSDDGIRLSVNDKLLIDNWTIHAPTENKGTIALQAGKSYSIQLEYYENGGGAVAKLLWSSPSLVKQVIPASQLATAQPQEDLCPHDPNKTEPGLCGCGVPEGTCEPCGSQLVANQRLHRDEFLCSPNGLYQFGLDADGDLVLSSSAEDVWSAGLCCDAATLNMQGDGNLVVRNNANAAKWNSKTANNAGAVLTVDDDGRAVIRLGKVELWSAQGKTTTDLCPSDPNKTQPGTCGCGVPEGSCDDYDNDDCDEFDYCVSDFTIKHSSTRAWRFSQVTDNQIIPNVGKYSGNGRAYFGQLHEHSRDSSDAPNGGSVDDVYKLGEQRGLDFIAVTDHARNITQSRWENQTRKDDQYTNDDEFVGLSGFEITEQKWDGRPEGRGTSMNHTNIFNSNWLVGRVRSYQDTLWYIKQDPYAVGQFNHPDSGNMNHNNFIYDALVDRVMNLIELSRGGNVAHMWGQFIKALDNGWHVAPTAQEDQHGTGYGTMQARTGIIADGLTKAHIIDAMRNRRVYTTTDSNMQVSFKGNGQEMGSVLDGPSSITFKLDIQDNENISKIEVFTKGGNSVRTINVSDGQKNFTISGLDPGKPYYFVRITQQDGEQAITAPIWTR